MAENVSQQTRFYPTQNATQQRHFNDEKNIDETKKEIAQVLVLSIKFFDVISIYSQMSFSFFRMWDKEAPKVVYDKKIKTAALPNVFHSNFDLHYYEKKHTNNQLLTC